MARFERRRTDKPVAKDASSGHLHSHLDRQVSHGALPNRPWIGWKEWVELPELGIGWIEAKTDSGARSNSLDVHSIETFRRDRKAWIRFFVVSDIDLAMAGHQAESPLIDYREVRSSSGHVTHRPVIETKIQLGPYTWSIELTLVSRHAMGYRMLLGRSGLGDRFLIDPAQSHLLGKSIP